MAFSLYDLLERDRHRFSIRAPRPAEHRFYPWSLQRDAKEEAFVHLATHVIWCESLLIWLTTFSLKHLFVNGFSLFPQASLLSPEDIQSVQEQVRKRVVKLFHRKGILNSDEASDMLSWDHGGFSLDANVRIDTQDRAGLERLIRYCARPIFSGERLDCAGDKLRYILPKPTPDGQMVLMLKPWLSKASLFRWAKLLARIFEVDPLCCPKCNHPMRIIAFIEDPHTIRKILTHINLDFPATAGKALKEVEF